MTSNLLVLKKKRLYFWHRTTKKQCC